MATVNSISILNYLKDHYGQAFSKQEIAAALGLPIAAVTGTMNSLQKKGYATVARVEEVVEAEATETRKAKIKSVPYHTLTEEGLAYDPVAEAQAKEEAKAAERERRAAEKAARKAATAAE